MSIMEKMIPKNGIKILISGGASGIGATLARAFIEVGARVHVCDIDDAALEHFRTCNPASLASKTDAGSGEDIRALFDLQRREFGGLDILVNNVGIAGPTAPIDQIGEDEWQRTININLNSQYRFAHLAVPLLRQSDCAQILCMSSVAGRLGYALRTPYAATKWAIVGFMKSLAIELGKDDIRVNALLPGVVEGARMDEVIMARAVDAGISYDEMKAEYLSKIALGRMVNAEDVAALALFLCSPAGRNISGQAISVDGNITFL